MNFRDRFAQLIVAVREIAWKSPPHTDETVVALSTLFQELGNDALNSRTMLREMHEHVFQACRVLGVDTEEQIGDSWTLIETCKKVMAGFKQVQATAMQLSDDAETLAGRVKVLEKALDDILELAADRERFVRMGPRGMASCVVIAEKALRKALPPVPGVEHESDGLE